MLQHLGVVLAFDLGQDLQLSLLHDLHLRDLITTVMLLDLVRGAFLLLELEIVINRAKLPVNREFSLGLFFLEFVCISDAREVDVRGL